MTFFRFCSLSSEQKRNKIQSPAWEQMSLRILDAMATVSELSDWEFIASCKAFCTPSWQLPNQSETRSIIILNIENVFQTVFSHLHSQFFSRFSAIIFATADLPKCFGSQANHPAISPVAIQGSNQCFQRTSLVSMQRKEEYYSVRQLRCHSVWFYLLLLWKLLVSTSSCHEAFLKRPLKKEVDSILTSMVSGEVTIGTWIACILRLAAVASDPAQESVKMRHPLTWTWEWMKKGWSSFHSSSQCNLRI